MRQAALLLILASLAGLTQADTIRLRSDAWFPLNGDPGAVRPGFGIEALQRIWGPAGYRLDYQLMSWSRSLEAVRDGQADCVIGADEEEAGDLLIHREPLGTDATKLYVRAADLWRFNSIEDLGRRSVAVISDYSYGEALDAWLSDSRNATRIQMAYGADALEGNIRKLLAGQVDVVPESPMVMSNALRRLNLERFVTVAGVASPPAPFYVACTAGNAEAEVWLATLDEGLRRLRASGEWQALLSEYGVSE
jgi:polar amino acid transport system substrate-binding protein